MRLSTPAVSLVAGLLRLLAGPALALYLAIYQDWPWYLWAPTAPAALLVVLLLEGFLQGLADRSARSR